MRVSVLGLGLMGTAIAERLLSAGHELAVWNRTASAAQGLAERGVNVLRRPCDAWSHGDLALVMLAHTAAVDATLLGSDGLLSDVGADTADTRTLIDMSTISVEGSRRLAAAAEAARTDFVRAPVTGNPSVLATGNLGIIVSGPRPAYDRVHAVLRDVGPNHWYVGEREEARVIKLGLNLMLGGTAQLMAEALVMAERNGVSRDLMLEVVSGSAIGSPFVKYKTEALVADDYTSTFTARGLHKDFKLALECAEASDVPLPLTAVVQQLLQACIAQGMGDLDFMALLPHMRHAAGLADPRVHAVAFHPREMNSR